MKILVKRTIHYYIDKYPLARNPLLAWHKEFSENEFSNFNEVKTMFGNASIIANSRIVFNIKGNDFRLIISVSFRQNASYVIWFGTHSEYDKINAETVLYDKNIDEYKKKKQ